MRKDDDEYYITGMNDAGEFVSVQVLFHSGDDDEKLTPLDEGECGISVWGPESDKETEVTYPDGSTGMENVRPLICTRKYTSEEALELVRAALKVLELAEIIEENNSLEE